MHREWGNGALGTASLAPLRSASADGECPFPVLDRVIREYQEPAKVRRAPRRARASARP